jgi:hypothetical protein
MRKSNLIFVIVALFMSSCEEIPPVVSGTSSPRKVLIEEFTGVRCVNCPAGSALIEDLLAAHGDQLVAVSIHAGVFAPPYPQSKYDFRTQEGTQIQSYVGEPFGYPSAVVNRKLFNGESSLQLGSGKWAGFIGLEKGIPPKVKIDVTTAFDSGSRNLQAEVTLFVEETIADADVRLSLYITESGIVDYQLVPGSTSPKPDYVHKHVLRGTITNYDGTPINESLKAGSQITRTFNYTLPANWKEENCKLVTFVSLAGNNKEVLQAHESSIY